MSLEEALAFESEALSKGLQGRDVEKIATALDKDEDLGKLSAHAKTHEDVARLHFFSEHDRKKRLAMLYDDREVQRAIVGDREAEKFGLMGEEGVVGRGEEYRRGKAGFNAEQLKVQEKVHPVDERRRKAKIEQQEQKEGFAQKSGEDLYETGEEQEEARLLKEGWTPGMISLVHAKMNLPVIGEVPSLSRIGHDWLGGAAPGTTQAMTKEQQQRQTRERAIEELKREKTLPGADKEDLQWRIDRNKLLNDPEELDRHFDESRKHRAGGSAAPAAGGEDHVSRELLRHTERQTQLLEQLVAKNQSVHVDVHPPAGSPSPRVNATRRPEPSWSTALGANH